MMRQCDNKNKKKTRSEKSLATMTGLLLLSVLFAIAVGEIDYNGYSVYSCIVPPTTDCIRWGAKDHWACKSPPPSTSCTLVTRDLMHSAKMEALRLKNRTRYAGGEAALNSFFSEFRDPQEFESFMQDLVGVYSPFVKISSIGRVKF